MDPVLRLIVFGGLALPVVAQPYRMKQLSAKLTGFSDSAVYDGDKIASLTITAAIKVKSPGSYRLTFNLTAANGNSLPGQALADLKAGAQSLTVSFEAKQIGSSLAQDGPYQISRPRLVLERQNAQPTDADGLAEGGMTAAYSLGDLQRDLYSFTGEIEAAGADATTDGKFRVLRVRAGIVTPGGDCVVGGRLSSPTALIDWENGERRQQVPPGKSTVTIDFRGPQIAQSGVDGPLTVSDLRLSCAARNTADRAFAEDHQKHRTPRFHFSDFDPDPDFELVVPPPVRVAAGDPISVYLGIRTTGTFMVPIQLTARADDPLRRREQPDPRARKWLERLVQLVRQLVRHAERRGDAEHRGPGPSLRLRGPPLLRRR